MQPNNPRPHLERRERKTKAAQAEATRSVILEVAEQLFAERGYAGAPADDVADYAGVTRGALQHHFGDKRGLFRAVAARVSDRLLSRIVAATSREQIDALQAVEAGCLAYLDACTDPATNRILFQDAPSVLTPAEIDGLSISAGSGLLVSGIEKAIHDGFIDAVSAEALACMLLGALNCAGLEIARSAKAKATHRAYSQLLSRLLRGLRPDRGVGAPGSRTPAGEPSRRRRAAGSSRS
ncbi:TetR/AcrR family transcriptional regulator [Enhydrobacter sp.]|uniref:TetR/AcrR family transcriptional regulator n=1 Tax=Enhydrobacter sp. TaxID=1894999 RepID=UPI00261FCD2A|nr:TetR/AcrR family transcriptional regulator [Enhydrobacter sp.]